MRCDAAGWGGHLSCLKYAHENEFPWDWAACFCAAHGGHLPCLQYAHNQGCPWNEATCSGAQGGHLS